MSDPNEDSFPLVPSDSRELVERMDRNLELLDRLLGEAELAETGNAPLAGPTSLTVSGIDLVWCPPGTFLMGSPPEEAERGSGETQHPVTLTRGFWIGKYPVTQAQYRAVMETNPSHFQGDRLPVETVSWDDAMAWCRRMNETALDTPPGYGWTLPTEAQWEYACRAGTTTPFSFGTQLNGQEANCNGNSPYGTPTKGPSLKRTTEVGSYPANPWGIHDMHGNVWEWCRDWCGDFPTQAVTDPVGAAQGADRVLRGGCWYFVAGLCRAAYRLRYSPSIRGSSLGFRPAVSPP
jgi:formylglycine-generating enzyme required for sulfatase activity